ncbi:MAG: flagellar hook capping FlgD N-terminal domain-containing protein [Phycisphaerales bacterium]
MSAAAIGGTATAQATQSKNNSFGELSSEEFINILVTELTQQDPFKPNDSSAILEQLSSLRNIESQVSLQEQLKTMVDQNAISSASGMIGQQVTGLNSSNQTVSGIVRSVVIENGTPILKLEDGTRLEASRITDVANLGDFDTQVVQQLLRNLIILNSSALVGKMVSGFNENNTLIEGVVTSVRNDDDDLILELDNGQELSAGAVRYFSNAQEKSAVAAGNSQTDVTTE